MKKWIKEKYRRFRQWQLHPNELHVNTATSHCANCGTDFEGNFCSQCGQRAATGRLTIKSLFSSVAMMWGIGSRSMPYTLWQLIWRPGYLIRDYLIGKRQSCFPPVKMAFIVAVVLSLFRMWVLPDFSAEDVDEFGFLNDLYRWGSQNPALLMTIISLFFIVPTWVFFRESPCYPHHTLVEGFFIQAFCCTPMLIISFGVPEMLFFSPLTLLIFAYYYYVYKQLFGYGYWSTLWRCVVAAITMFLCESVVILLSAVFLEQLSDIEAYRYPIAVVVVCVILIILFTAGYLIDHRRATNS